MAQSSIDKIINKVQREMINEATTIAKKATKEAARKSERLLSRTYDSIIEQYYLYKTTSYYRHDTGIGTGTGMNLYRSNDIGLDSGFHYLNIDINANDMSRYPRADANFILDRFLFEGKRGGDVLIGGASPMFFKASVDDGFGKTYEGVPADIIKSLTKNIEKTYYQKYFTNIWNAEVRSGKYTYFKKKGWGF